MSTPPLALACLPPKSPKREALASPPDALFAEAFPKVEELEELLTLALVLNRLLDAVEELRALLEAKPPGPELAEELEPPLAEAGSGLA